MNENCDCLTICKEKKIYSFRMCGFKPGCMNKYTCTWQNNENKTKSIALIACDERLRKLAKYEIMSTSHFGTGNYSIM